MGDVLIPVAEVTRSELPLGDDKYHYTRRATFTLLGDTLHVSIIWGTGTYSVNRNATTPNEMNEEPHTVEIAIWPSTEEPSHDYIYGWQTTSDVLALMNDQHSQEDIADELDTGVDWK